MSARGRASLTMVRVVTALTKVRVDVSAYQWSWWIQLRQKWAWTCVLNNGHSSDMSARGRAPNHGDGGYGCAWTCVLNSGHGGYSSDMSARGRVCLTMEVVMVDTALT